MKTKICTLLLLLISAASFNSYSQTALPSSGNNSEQGITSIKSFESKYVNGKIYLHATVNGNTETKALAVERSIDGANYEVIGYIKMIGTNVQCNLSYYFTDESPVKTNLYYRFSDYTLYNEPAYSETLLVIPVDEIKTPEPIVLTETASVSVSGEKQNFISSGISN